MSAFTYPKSANPSRKYLPKGISRYPRHAYFCYLELFQIEHRPVLRENEAVVSYFIEIHRKRYCCNGFPSGKIRFEKEAKNGEFDFYRTRYATHHTLLGGMAAIGCFPHLHLIRPNAIHHHQMHGANRELHG